MHNTTLHLYTTQLICSAIDKNYTIDAKLYDNCDFFEILKLSLDHNITSLIYEGIINSNISIDEELDKLFKQRVIFECVKSESQISCYKSIVSLFEKHDIPYIPLKGICMKNLYPKPELRRMGDIDIYVDEKNIEKVEHIMSELQFEPCGRTDYDYKFKNVNDILIEIHTSIVSRESEFYDYYQNPWRLCKKDEKVIVHTLNEEEMYIYLFLHFMKHYRGGGIGINHIVDLWIYKKVVPHLDEDYINSKIEQFGLMTFYDNTLRMTGCLFGNRQEDAIVSEMVEFVVNSGSYGTKETHQAAVVIKNERNSKSKARLKTMLEKIILPREKMEYKYPILKKRPYLLFFCRCHRLFRRVFFMQDKELNMMGVIKANSSQKIDEYKNHLKKVGL